MLTPQMSIMQLRSLLIAVGENHLVRALAVFHGGGQGQNLLKLAIWFKAGCCTCSVRGGVGLSKVDKDHHTIALDCWKQ